MKIALVCDMDPSRPSEAPAPRRAPGRPRDPEVEKRLKRAALEVLARHGISGVSLEKICEQAGAPRATFYRRWATPMQAVGEAFNEAFHMADLPDTGDIVADLIAFTKHTMALYNDPVLGPCMSFLIAECRVRPELHASHGEAFLHRRAHNRQVVERAIARGHLDGGVSPDLVIDVLSGLAMNHQATRRPLSDEMLELVIRRLLALPADPPAQR